MNPPHPPGMAGEAGELLGGGEELGAAGLSCHPTGTTAARPQGGGKHQGPEDPRAVSEGLLSKELFSDG